MVNEYTPDVVSPPGGTLEDLLEEHQMTQAELALRTGRPPRLINEIIRGKATITPATALQFERVFGVPAHFWLNRERDYQEYLERKRQRSSLSQTVGWLKEIPVAALRKAGFISKTRDKVQQVIECLQFFGVAHPDAWREVYHAPQAAFRKSPTLNADPGAIAAWLRAGELAADELSCPPFSRDRFLGSLQEIRTLTLKDFTQARHELVELCTCAGVVVAFIPEIPGARVSGATRWLSPQRALIQLSLRYRKDDHFWFTFFHEAGHILLHGKKAVFLETKGVSSELEKEADTFACDRLIPPGEFRDWVKITKRAGSYWSHDHVQAFADRIGIAPGIVVGRLQHEGLLPHTHLNGLKRTVSWTRADSAQS